MNFEYYLHNRIIIKCTDLFKDGHYPQAAFEAMKQVEIALKEKSNIHDNLFGSRLIDYLLGDGKGIKLKIPFDEDLQKEARILFKGAFSYYRNYSAHNGDKINEIICYRIMILASELLDLIEASSISFTEIGGIKGLIDKGIFKNEKILIELLEFLSNQTFPYETFDEMFESLYEKGFSDFQYQSVFDLGLIVYKSKYMNNGFSKEAEDWDNFGWIELTELGKELLK